MSYMYNSVTELLGSNPALLVWFVCVILSAFIVGRGQGTSAEKLLLLGCSLMFLSEIYRTLFPAFSLWLVQDRCVSKAVAGQVNWLINVMGFAGIAYLTFAFLIHVSEGKETNEDEHTKRGI